jgi:hypothetical protein
MAAIEQSSKSSSAIDSSEFLGQSLATYPPSQQLQLVLWKSSLKNLLIDMK